MAVTDRDRFLAKVYNLTEEDYVAMLNHQGGTCAICWRPPVKNRLAIDHDHKTGLIRGLVCLRDNAVIAKALDDPIRLRRAADYLTLPPAVQAIGERFGNVGPVRKRRRKR